MLSAACLGDGALAGTGTLAEGGSVGTFCVGGGCSFSRLRRPGTFGTGEGVRSSANVEPASWALADMLLVAVGTGALAFLISGFPSKSRRLVTQGLGGVTKFSSVDCREYTAGETDLNNVPSRTVLCCEC